MSNPAIEPTHTKTTGWETAVTTFPKVLIGLALLAFVGYFVVYNMYAIALFQFPFDYDQGEGFELMDTVLFSQGEWPYRDNDSYPFYSSNYPPLFHVVIVPLVWAFGPQYWTGRLVSYLGTLITAAAIGYAVQKAGKRWWLSVLVGLAFLASNYVYHVGPLFRQHMFMVMFEAVAVVYLARTVEKEEADGRSRNKRLLVVMLLLLAAGYTKQLAYATVAAVFIFLFLRQPKRAVTWAVPFAAVTGLIFLWLNIATDGYWFLNTVTANINPFIPGQAEGLFRQWFRLHIVLTIAAGLFAVYQLYFERLSLYSIWFVVAVLNSVTAGKWGAGESYFATAIAASCILTGFAFNRLLASAKTKPFTIHSSQLNIRYLAVATVIPLLFLFQARQMFHMPTHTPILAAIANALGYPTEVMIAPQTSCSAPRDPEPIPYVDSAGVSLLGRLPTAADTAAGIEITEHILQGETAAFSEDAGFNFRAGRDIVTNPTQLLNLYNNNQVDLTEMLAMLNNQAFDTVILRAQFYPPPVLEAIGQQYETTDLVQMNGFVYCIMRPR
ncbi:ArnT family glycosyltransferase [Candidatus Leptofilum sp.]|uniref:ArnT family glycosyltransferase n=1 Tax=Candidatus Leptofilum sp. TaxID=3241576 RepID=UPI003B59E59B